jgi:hypothetical protein
MGTFTPIAALALTGLSAGVGAYGAIAQGQAARQEARYQSAVLKNNAISAENAAKDAEVRGRNEELKQRLRTKQLIGRQRAVLAANGVVVDQDSALDITADTAMLGELDALTIRDNARREAMLLRAQGSQFRSDADFARLRGRAANTSGLFTAGATLLGGAGSVASKWYQYDQYDQAGVFD